MDIKKRIIASLAECTPDFFFIQVGDHDGLHVVPAEIPDTGGEVTFCHSGITMLSSLPADEWISVPITVEDVSWRSVLERYHVTRIDLLQIDTEGSDFDIIRQIDFNAVRRTIIVFEVVHEDRWNVIGYTA